MSHRSLALDILISTRYGHLIKQGRQLYIISLIFFPERIYSLVSTEWHDLPSVGILPEWCLQENRLHSDLIVQLGLWPYILCLMCSLIKAQHSRGQDLNEKFYWKVLLWLAKGRRHPKTGHHTASIVTHDGQTEQLGSLLAKTVGSYSYHLKNFL